MTKVTHPRPTARAGPSKPLLNQTRAALPKKKPYKVVLEAVTQEKRKLRSNLTYHANAPKGFGFIPTGFPAFTEWCKEQCRQRNLDVHIVSAAPKNKQYNDPEKLSHHVHRIGHHFPVEIINLACTKFGFTYDGHSLHKVQGRDGIDWIEQQVEQYHSRHASNGPSRVGSETKAYIHGVVREMFPKIPESDLKHIVDYAFEKGSNRVGTSEELSLARRVQLAVVAHIRHTYTQYDSLLKSDGWSVARSQVEHVSLSKVKEWRDETGETSNEMEETFREIIVLDDDDDDDQSSADSSPDREQSMEIISHHATARDLEPERYDPRVHAQGSRRLPGRYIVAQSQPSLPRNPAFQQPLLARTEPLRPVEQVRQSVYPLGPSPPTTPRSRWPNSRASVLPSARPQNSSPIVQRIDGQIYELVPIHEDRDRSRVEYHQRPSGNVPSFMPQAPPRFQTTDRKQMRSHGPPEGDVVLPSVESEVIDLRSPRQGLTNGAIPQTQYQSRPLKRMASPLRDARSVRTSGSWSGYPDPPAVVDLTSSPRERLNPANQAPRTLGAFDHVPGGYVTSAYHAPSIAPLPRPYRPQHEQVQSRSRRPQPAYVPLPLPSGSSTVRYGEQPVLYGNRTTRNGKPY